MGVGFLGITLLTTFLLAQWQHKTLYVENVYAADEPEEVQIRVQIDWTEERIIEEIKKTFPEEPELALRIARCESNLKPNALNTTNTDGSLDRGVMQLNSVHDTKLDTLGLDPFDPTDNLTFARMLYEESGWIPWVCYTKNLI